MSGGVWKSCGTPVYAMPSIFDLFSMSLRDSAPKKTRETRLCDLKGSEVDFRVLRDNDLTNLTMQLICMAPVLLGKKKITR